MEKKAKQFSPKNEHIKSDNTILKVVHILLVNTAYTTYKPKPIDQV